MPWVVTSGHRCTLTLTRLRSVHTSCSASLPLEVVLPGSVTHIATYARVSSDEQRDRHTVRNQRAALDRRLSSEPGLSVFQHYEDDGVSGTIPLQERPGGCALVRDARARRFSQIWVVRADRLGRDAFDCYASGESLSPSASPSAPPTRTSTIPSTSISTPSSPPTNAASSSNVPPRA